MLNSYIGTYSGELDLQIRRISHNSHRKKNNIMKPKVLCREQFLKCPPPEYVAKSHLLNDDSKAPDDIAKKSRRREKRKSKKVSLDDSSNWVTDTEETSNENLLRSNKVEEICNINKRIQLMILYNIYMSQTNEVKEVILRLHKLQMKKINARCQKQLLKPKPLPVKKNKNKIKPIGKNCDSAASAIGLQFNCKLLARLQRRRRSRGKPLSQRRHKKFRRYKPRVGAKKGNKQGRKRYLRVQRLFDKGFFLAGPKLLDEVWHAVKDPNCTATSFCNNNIHCLSKMHRKQIALYEKIEEDLHRLNAARQERNEAAVERMAKENEKEVKRKGFKNKIEIRAAARAERDALRKQRRAARKQRALEKRMRKQQAKAEMIKCNEQE